MTFPAKTATQDGMLDLGTVPANKTKVIVKIQPATTVTGQNTNTRKFVVVEVDAHAALVQVCGELQLNQGVNLPAGQQTGITFTGADLHYGNTLKLASTHIGAGLAHPELDVVLAFEE